MNSPEPNNIKNTTDEKEKEGENERTEEQKAKKKKPPSPKRQNSDDDLSEILDPDLEAYIGGDGIGDLAEAAKQEDSGEEEEEEEEEETAYENSEGSEDVPLTPPSEEFQYVSEDDYSESDEESRLQRRFLVNQQSFLHLENPGLSRALIPQEQLDAEAAAADPSKFDKTRSGVKGERDAYKKLCQELGITPIRRFMESLRKPVMDFSHYRLNSKEIIAMCKILEDNHHVCWLSFEGNPAGDEGGEAIAKLIKNNYCITHLNIASTEIAGVLAIIFWALAQNVNLEWLDISKNNLEDEDMYCISEYLANSGSLKELNISRNHIGDGGLKALAEGLSTNVVLEVLDLSWNKIRGNKRAMPFFGAAAELRTLRVLNLGHNYVLDKAARGISRILSTSETIEDIDVSLGRFNAASGPLLARGVKKSKTLKRLNLELQNWRQNDVAGIVGATTNAESQMESLNFGHTFDVYKQFLKAESRTLRFHPGLKIQRGKHFGLYKAKGPDPKMLVMHRANVVCNNFGTPLRMLMDELRKEEKILTQKQFKKFIKSCNLYKDKVMTESLMRNFAHGFDVNCEAIIEAYDKAFPLTANDPLQRLLAASKTASKADRSGNHRHSSTTSIKKERDNSMHAMVNW